MNTYKVARVIILALMASGITATPVSSLRSGNTCPLQRRVLCGIFGSCSSSDGPPSPPLSIPVPPKRPRTRTPKTVMDLGANPVGNARELNPEELQNIFRPIRFFNGVPVFRHRSTSLLLLQSALRNYGSLYFTYIGDTRPPHLITYKNERVMLDTVSDADRASLANLVYKYSFASRYLNQLKKVL